MNENEKQPEGLEPLAHDERSALLDALFDSAPVGIGFWDTELRFRRLNAQLAEINGLPPEAHLGKRPGPDVLLLDLGLPGMNGLEVARRIRAVTPPIRIIAVTGWGQEQDRSRSAAAGFDAHLTKPIDAAQLFAALH